MTIEGTVEVMLIACAIPVNLYPLFYAFRPWWITPQGRALMVKATGNMILIDMILGVQFFGDYPGRSYVRLIGFGFFVAGTWWLLLSLLASPGARRYPPRSWLDRGGPSRNVPTPPSGPTLGSSVGRHRAARSPESLPCALPSDPETQSDGSP